MPNMDLVCSIQANLGKLSSLWLPIILLCASIIASPLAHAEEATTSNDEVDASAKADTTPATLSEAHFKKFPVESAQVVAPPIPDIANKDGSGLFWDLIRSAFEPLGLRVHINDMRLKTGVKMLQRYRSIDVVMGSQDQLEGTQLSFYPLLEISVSVMHPRGYSLKSVISTSKAPILLYRDLLLPKELSNHNRIRVCKSLKNCYRNLKRRKSVALFLNPADVKTSSHLRLSGYQLTPMETPLLAYAMFRDDVEGMALKKLLDLRLMEMSQGGELARLYDKWKFSLPTLYLKRNQPDWL